MTPSDTTTTTTVDLFREIARKARTTPVMVGRVWNGVHLGKMSGGLVPPSTRARVAPLLEQRLGEAPPEPGTLRGWGKPRYGERTSAQKKKAQNIQTSNNRRKRRYLAKVESGGITEVDLVLWCYVNIPGYYWDKNLVKLWSDPRFADARNAMEAWVWGQLPEDIRNPDPNLRYRNTCKKSPAGEDCGREFRSASNGTKYCPQCQTIKDQMDAIPPEYTIDSCRGCDVPGPHLVDHWNSKYCRSCSE